MIDYPIELNDFESDFETTEYDPFLHHVIRHKLRKKKNRRRLGRLIRKHPKNRVLRAIGIGRRRRRIRPVRTAHRRYAKSMRRPIRNTLVTKPRTNKKPFRLPPVSFGNPIHRDLKGIKKGRGFPYSIRRGRPIMPDNPLLKGKPPVFTTKPNKRKKPKVSRDIVIPYKRRYGKRKPRVMPRRIPKVNTPSLEEELPIMEDIPLMDEDMNKAEREVSEGKSETQKAKEQKDKQKRTIKNIIGIAALSVVAVSIVAYKLKTKSEANGRIS
jgi:hypothetical protein